MKVVKSKHHPKMYEVIFFGEHIGSVEKKGTSYYRLTWSDDFNDHFIRTPKEFFNRLRDVKDYLALDNNNGIKRCIKGITSYKVEGLDSDLIFQDLNDAIDCIKLLIKQKPYNQYYINFLINDKQPVNSGYIYYCNKRNQYIHTAKRIPFNHEYNRVLH